MITFADLQKASKGTPNKANAMAVLNSLAAYGKKFGLDKPHRCVQYIAQLMHESGEFRYDKEIWGPTAAQDKYDTRTDLGNTKAKDGDGKKYMGRTAVQITGKANYTAFRDWCRTNVDKECPDFEQDPDKVLTDPWEGLAPVWFWTTHNLNQYADTGNIEMITKKINGGLNGFDDRIDCYVRLSLVVLGYAVNALRQFQREAGVAIDGVAGPVTRSKLHTALVSLVSAQPASVMSAPVVQLEAVAPEAIDKPVTQTSGFWERIASIGGLSSIAGFASFLQDWRVIVAISGLLIVLACIGLFLHSRIINAVKAIKQEVNG